MVRISVFEILIFVKEREYSNRNFTFPENEPEINNQDTCPPVPPRKHRRRHTPPRPPSNGLPPTPKVHMGACFSKVNTEHFLNGCLYTSLQ